MNMILVYFDNVFKDSVMKLFERRIFFVLQSLFSWKKKSREQLFLIPYLVFFWDRF